VLHSNVTQRLRRDRDARDRVRRRPPDPTIAKWADIAWTTRHIDESYPQECVTPLTWTFTVAET